MKQFTILNADGSAGENIPEFVLVGEGDDARSVPLEERYHPDFIAQLVMYDPTHPPKAPEPPALPPPTVVTMKQARLALLQAGKLGAVNDAIRAIPGIEGDAARIEWEYAATVDRGSSLMRLMASGLQLDDSALDVLFLQAASR